MPAEKSAEKTGLRVIQRTGSPWLYVRGTVRGQRVFESTGTADGRLAEEYRATREAELYRAAIHGPGPARVAFHMAVDSYLDAKAPGVATRAFLGRLTQVWGPRMMCSDIGQEQIDLACRALCRPGAKPATKLRNVVTPARAVLNHAARRGWCQPPVFEVAAVSSGRTEWITPAEAEAMIAASTKRLRHMAPLLSFFFCTGARVNEALALDWADVDLQHARAVLRDTKNGADRHVDLPPRLVADLANHARSIHKAAAPKGRVFLDRARRPYRLTDDSRTAPYGGQLRASWRAVLKAAGITRQGLTPHTARHSWASWHYAVHRDLLLLRHTGAWHSVSIVERYAHLMPPTMAPAAASFWGSKNETRGRVGPSAQESHRLVS